MKREFQYFADLAEMSEHAARFIVELAQRRVKEDGAFTFVLSGGHTPRLLYETLCLPRFSSPMPWSETYVFWGDERCVSKGSPESNYAMARESLLLRVSLPPENTYRMPAEIKPPQEAAAEYEKRLRTFFAGPESASGSLFPCFDLILLGMGSDGHTASLFPGDPAVEERKRWVTSVPGLAAKPPVPRITLTLPVINQAAYILFLVAGDEKESVLTTIRRDPQQAARLYPAAQVRARERLMWYGVRPTLGSPVCRRARKVSLE